jgi:hypothetical protein
MQSTSLNRTDSGDQYIYNALPTAKSFRVAEVFPGRDGDGIYCKLHIVDWVTTPNYEAISYAWGDPNIKAPVICDGSIIQVTQSLHTALEHLRHEDRSRFVWADALW